MNFTAECVSVGLAHARPSDNRAQRQRYMVARSLDFGPDCLDLNSSTSHQFPRRVTLVKFLPLSVSQSLHLLLRNNNNNLSARIQ